MQRADDKIEMFNNEGDAGSVNGMQPKRGDPTELPGVQVFDNENENVL